MGNFFQIRAKRNISQRKLADLAGISYKTLQLIESGRHDPKLSTLERLSKALGYPPHLIQNHLRDLWHSPPDSVAMISERLLGKKENQWRIHLFNFVDAFRAAKKKNKKDFVARPPSDRLSPKMKALLASTVEELCEEAEIGVPDWCHAVPPLQKPWFVSGVENLKAMALAESPLAFRKRNIFVLENFLSRA